MGAFGDKQIYRAIYTNKNGLLPYGTEIQFISDKYNVEKWYFDKPLDWNFKEDIVASCKRTYGIDVSSEFMPGSHPFKVESVTYRQRQSSVRKQPQKGKPLGCAEALRIMFKKLLIVAVGIIVIIIAAAVVSAIYD